MIRIIKDGIKILFLLAGILFIGNVCAQSYFYGGSNNGFSTSTFGTCSPVTLVSSGGSFDGAAASINISCTIPTMLAMGGGSNNGFASSVLGGCSQTTLVASGGSFDGASGSINISCTLPTMLAMGGGSNNGFASGVLGSCTTATLVASGGSYDGHASSINVCPTAAPLSMGGGINSGFASSVFGSCTYNNLVASGGSFDGFGSSINVCPTAAPLSMGGGINNGFASSIFGSCTYNNLVASGGAYDGSTALASISCYIPTLLLMGGGDNNGFSASTFGSCTPTNLAASGGSFDGAASKLILCNALRITSFNTTNATCQCNGSSVVNVTGGTAPYTYLWSSGGTNSSVTGLCTGVYYVTVTDALSTQVVGSTTVVQSGASLSISFSSSNATCGNNNGSATVSASGGTQPYSYSWSTGGTDASITGLSPGSYTVTVSETGGCSVTGTTTIINVAGPTVNISSQTDVSCYGGNNGSLSASVSGGTSPFTYYWSNSVSSASISSLPVGNYTVTVTDANGCTQTAAATITSPSAISPAISSQTDVSCNGGSDGSITVNPSGGVIPYTYEWNTSPVQTTATANNLSAGNYSVTVTDDNGCTAIASSTITEPAVLITSASSDSPVCLASNLNLSSTTTGGTTNYTYSWSGPSSFISTDANPTIVSVSVSASGTYFLTVTDANGCTATSSTAVTVNICTTTLNLNVFIEGYYIGGGQMQPTALNESVPTATGAETDTISVLLHDVGNPAIVSDSAGAILMTDGTATAIFNGTATGNSYWIAVRHRNTVETWSNSAVSLSAVTSYDFTSGAGQAYGGNMIQVDFGPDLWAAYNGDINQDQNVDLLDFPDMDYGINNGLFGYYNTDLNGDGNVDLLDFPVLDANINNGIFSAHP